VAFQDLSSENSIGCNLLGEEIAVPSYVVEFDFDYFFLAVAAID
jgi:hypothetical protein